MTTPTDKAPLLGRPAPGSTLPCSAKPRRGPWTWWQRTARSAHCLPMYVPYQDGLPRNALVSTWEAAGDEPCCSRARPSLQEHPPVRRRLPARSRLRSPQRPQSRREGRGKQPRLLGRWRTSCCRTPASSTGAPAALHPAWTCMDGKEADQTTTSREETAWVHRTAQDLLEHDSVHV